MGLEEVSIKSSRFFELIFLVQSGIRLQSMRTTATDVGCREYSVHT